MGHAGRVEFSAGTHRGTSRRPNILTNIEEEAELEGSRWGCEKLTPTLKYVVGLCSSFYSGPNGVFTLDDTWSFLGLTSKIPLLGAMVTFDADVKMMTTRHLCEKR